MLLLLSVCTGLYDSNTAYFDTQQGRASLSPIQQTQTLYFTENTTAKVRYQLEGTLKLTQAVDILLLFDRTMSMKREIDETAKAARSIVNDIQDEAPNTRFALAAVSDYSPMFTPEEDKRTWLVLSDFTKSANQIAKATDAIQLSNGGDNPEAYSRGLFEASQMQWRPEAKKIILFFGDAVDHPVDPGRDEVMGTADDLNIELVLDKLNAQNIKLIGINTSQKPHVQAFFEKISQATGGSPVPLEDASETGQVIIDSIKDSLRQHVALKANGAYQDWIEISQVSSHLKETNFVIMIRPPEGTDAGVYNIPLLFNLQAPHDSTMAPASEQTMNLRVITGWYNHPLLLWLPLLLLIVILLWQTFKMLSGGYAYACHVTSSRQYHLDAYSILHLIIDILAVVSVFTTGLAGYLCWNGMVLSQVLV